MYVPGFVCEFGDGSTPREWPWLLAAELTAQELRYCNQRASHQPSTSRSSHQPGRSRLSFRWPNSCQFLDSPFPLRTSPYSIPPVFPWLLALRVGNVYSYSSSCPTSELNSSFSHDQTLKVPSFLPQLPQLFHALPFLIWPPPPLHSTTRPKLSPYLTNFTYYLLRSLRPSPDASTASLIRGHHSLPHDHRPLT